MTNNIMFKILSLTDIYPSMLENFKHRQYISTKWVKGGNGWELTKASELREWSDEKRIWITQYLCQQIERGGYVAGAFYDNHMIGYAAVDGVLGGEYEKYANLTMLFVDEDWQRQGIGKELFRMICQCATGIKAEKLFISAIPSYDTIAFYFNIGCSDAKEKIDNFVDTENDRYLEYTLKVED